VKKALLILLLLIVAYSVKAQSDSIITKPVIKPDTVYEEPTAAQKKLINGKVVFRFIVERDGTLSDIKIIKGLSPELDKIALQKLKSSPKWKPALINGHPVRKRITFDMTFEGYKKK
jgi:TonB family protein